MVQRAESRPGIRAVQIQPEDHVEPVAGRIPPHDLDAEAAVLSAILLEPDAFEKVQPVLQAEHFYSEANRRIYEAALALKRLGTPVDIVSVAGLLRDRSRIAQVGGMAYIAELLDAVPSVAHVETYARMVREKWRIRGLIATCQRVAAEGYGAIDEVQAFIERASQDVAVLAATPQSEFAARAPADRARVLGAKSERIPTGFATLDALTRGGPRAGKVVIIGGAPGAGKTTFATQLGCELARRGTPVAIVAADEEADGLLIRVGQNENLSREDLENGVEEARQTLSDRLRDLPFLLFDADEDDVTVEIAAAELTKLAGARPGVLIVDSIQTVSASGTEEADGPRGRVDAVMAALKRLAKQTGHLVIATSEVSRGWYRNSNDRIDPLAAFKESGGIEYGASIALAMVNVKGEDDVVDAIVAKNRQGKKGAFRLRLSFARARFEEITMPAAEDVAVDIRHTEEARFARARERILTTLRAHTTLATMTAVSRVAGKNKKENLDALRELTEEGAITRVAGVYRITPTAPNGGAL